VLPEQPEVTRWRDEVVNEQRDHEDPEGRPPVERGEPGSASEEDGELGTTSALPGVLIPGRCLGVGESARRSVTACARDGTE